MNELKPCPFCGGKAFINLERDCRWIECSKCGAMGYVEIGGDEEAIEAWNMRADDYRQAAEYWQRMYEEAFVERTCEEFGSLRIWQECYVWSHELSCGHEVDTLDMEPPNYCPECGAKVVDA